RGLLADRAADLLQPLVGHAVDLARRAGELLGEPAGAVTDRDQLLRALAVPAGRRDPGERPVLGVLRGPHLRPRRRGSDDAGVADPGDVAAELDLAVDRLELALDRLGLVRRLVERAREGLALIGRQVRRVHEVLA